MQNLKVLTLQQSQEWDQIVRSFSDYDVYYLSGYVKAFRLHGDGEPLLFYYESGGLRGINVVMKRDISKDPCFAEILPENKYFDFSTPYGYGGWLLEGKEDIPSLFAVYEHWCLKNAVVSEFVRFHPVLENHTGVQDAYEVVYLGRSIAIDLSSPEEIWTNLTSQNRSRIRKAKKNMVQVYHGRCPELFDLFKKLYDLTMDKDHADNYYYFQDVFYNSVLYDLPQNAQIFYARKDEEIIAAYVVLAANGYLHYHLGGSRQEYLSIAPNNLLMYEIALWGYANGYRTLHLGGGLGAREDNLYRFKKTFYCGEPRKFHIGRKIFLPKVYEDLTAMRTDIPEGSRFFPRYRA